MRPLIGGTALRCAALLWHCGCIVCYSRTVHSTPPLPSLGSIGAARQRREYSCAHRTVALHSIRCHRWAPRGNEPHKGQRRSDSIRSAGAAALGGDCDGAAAGAHGSLLAAVSAQRDRFRAKAQLLEEESEKVKRQGNALVRRRAVLFCTRATTRHHSPATIPHCRVLVVPMVPLIRSTIVPMMPLWP